MTGSRALGDALARGRRPSSLTAADRAMLAYAVRLTGDPGGMTGEDTGALRRAGFDDRAILDICQVTAYYNYVNRLADGLGVALEEGWTDEDCTLAPAEFAQRRESRR